MERPDQWGRCKRTTKCSFGHLLMAVIQMLAPHAKNNTDVEITLHIEDGLQSCSVPPNNSFFLSWMLEWDHNTGITGEVQGDYKCFSQESALLVAAVTHTHKKKKKKGKEEKKISRVWQNSWLFCCYFFSWLYFHDFSWDKVVFHKA